MSEDWKSEFGEVTVSFGHNDEPPVVFDPPTMSPDDELDDDVDWWDAAGEDADPLVNAPDWPGDGH